MDVFYQLIGLGALAAMALSFYQKGKRQIMVWQMAAFACFILHYGLIGALSGALCNVVQILSMLLFAARDRFHWPVLAAAIPIFLCYGVLGWYSYESPLALLPVIASGVFSKSRIQSFLQQVLVDSSILSLQYPQVKFMIRLSFASGSRWFMFRMLLFGI